MTFPFKSHWPALSIYILGMAFLIGFAAMEFILGAVGFTAGILAIVVIIAAIAYPQRIEVKGGFIVVRSGLFTLRRTRISDISRVHASKGWPLSHTMHPVSGWSISAGQKDYLVIPKDEKGFLDAVAQQAPQLHRYGQELRLTPVVPTE